MKAVTERSICTVVVRATMGRWGEAPRELLGAPMGILLGLVPSALHPLSNVGQITRREVEEMAHSANQRLLMTR